MATFKVYKFRGQDFYGFYSLRFVSRSHDPSSGNGSLPGGLDLPPEPVDFIWAVKFSVVGDVYLGEEEEQAGFDIHSYLLSCFYHAFARRYVDDLGNTPSFAPNTIRVSGPPVESKVEVTTYVEPVLGNTEVVYRRCRLDDAGTLNFYLSHSPEVAPGEYNLGSLVRPAPRTLFSEEVAERFRSFDSGGSCDCK